MWIGLTSAFGARKLTWQWADGAPVLSDKWEATYPSQLASACGKLSTEVGYDWLDSSCDMAHPFICGYPTGKRQYSKGIIHCLIKALNDLMYPFATS